MEQRSFAAGARVSVLGVGCGRVGSINNPVPMKEVEATLEAAVEAGVNLFDTANIYGQGDSERTLRRLLRRHRERMFVVTKVGGHHGRYSGIVRLAKPLLRLMVQARPHLRDAVVRARTATVSHSFRPPDLRRAVESSRRRLGLDQLDGLLLHNPSLETLNDPQIREFLAEMLQTGRARHVGASVQSLAEVTAALTMPAVSILQMPVTVANQLSGTDAVEDVRRRGIGVFVREVLSGRAPHSFCLSEPISVAIAPNFVTAAVIGVSTRGHLNELLAAIS